MPVSPARWVPETEHRPSGLVARVYLLSHLSGLKIQISESEELGSTEEFAFLVSS